MRWDEDLYIRATHKQEIMNMNLAELDFSFSCN
jgi:hypothetical protein